MMDAGEKDAGERVRNLHATAVAVDGSCILLRGASGSGKSDLALRLIDEGARLVADDRTLLRTAGDRLVAFSPAALAGLLEVRGLGVVRTDYLAAAPVALVVDLVPPQAVSRHPPPRRVELLGRMVPALVLAPFEASATAKLRRALTLVAETGLPAPAPESASTPELASASGPASAFGSASVSGSASIPGPAVALAPVGRGAPR